MMGQDVNGNSLIVNIRFVIIKNESKGIVFGNQRNRTVIIRRIILPTEPQAVCGIRLDLFTKLKNGADVFCIAGRVGHQSRRVHPFFHRVSDGKKKSLFIKGGFRQNSVSMTQQLPVIPPHAGVDRDIRVKEPRMVDQCIDCKQAPEGMTYQHAMRIGWVMSLYIRDQLLFQERSKYFTTPRCLEKILGFSIRPPEGMGGREIPRPVGVRDGHNNHFRAERIFNEVPQKTRNSMKMSGAVQQVQYRITLPTVRSLASFVGHIDPDLSLLFQQVKVEAVDPANRNGRKFVAGPVAAECQPAEDEKRQE